MAFLAGHRDLVPTLALGRGDDADGSVLSFQDWSLFDMQLEIGADFMGPRRFRACISDAF